MPMRLATLLLALIFSILTISSQAHDCPTIQKTWYVESEVSAKSWWSEKHHGVKEVVNDKGEIKFEYSIDKNSELAKNLKGRLLLTTGDIDNNVHPANTLRMAQALIKAKL